MASDYDRRKVLNSVATAWKAAADTGLDQAPAEIAQAALDRAADLRAQAATPAEDVAPRRAELLRNLAEGAITLTQAVEESRRLDDIDTQGERGRALLKEAVAAAHRAGYNALAEYGERLITDHLAPAFARVVEELETLAPKVEGITSDAEAMRAPKATREHWARAVLLADQAERLRKARSSINGFVAQINDSKHYREFRDHRHPLHLDEVKALIKAGEAGENHSARRLLLHIAVGAEPGIYTAAQVDAWSREHDQYLREHVKDVA